MAHLFLCHCIRGIHIRRVDSSFPAPPCIDRWDLKHTCHEGGGRRAIVIPVRTPEYMDLVR